MTSTSGQKEQHFQMDRPMKRSVRKSLKQYLTEYCESSSIQGLNYMIKDISTFERIWWILVFILCIGGCIFMILEIVDKWRTSPVLVSLATKDTPIYEIPFPAVTICPETKIQASCLNYTRFVKDVLEKKETNATEMKLFDYMSVLCNEQNHEATEDKDDFFDEEKLFSFLDSCESTNLILSYCQWKGKEVPCNEILKPIVTDEGICYTFNMFDIKDLYSDSVVTDIYGIPEEKYDWDVEEGYPPDIGVGGYPRRMLLSGAENSLVVVFFTDVDDITYSCKDFAYQGMRISLHMPSRIPRPSQIFFNVGLDRMVTAAIIPTMMTTSETIRRYDAEDRHCFFTNERKLKYFKLYSQSNCNLECYTNFTLAQCDCVDYYMPRENGTKICGVGKRQCLDDAEIQYPAKSLESKLEAKKKGEKSQLDCNCMPMCVDLNYNVELSSGVWEWKEHLEGYPKRFMELLRLNHASAVRIFFKNNFFLPMERSELYGTSDFISNFGGILGLFTGFSLFSIAEIVYFLSVRLIENYRHYGYWAGTTD